MVTPAAPQEIEAEIEIVEEPIVVDEAKYNAIEDVEERAYEVLKDFGMLDENPSAVGWQEPAYTFTYLQAPELLLSNEQGGMYLDSLRINTLTGAGSMTSYLDSFDSSSTVFVKGKSGLKLGATASYLDSICDLIQPILDLENNCSGNKVGSTQPPHVFEAALKARYVAIKNMGEKAFQILKDLCSIGRCEDN